MKGVVMAIIAKDTGGGDFEKTPTGNQQAVCAFVEDIGTHRGEYKGVPNERHQIVVCWELAETMTTGDYAGKPFMISNFYTLSLSEKAKLRKDLESWRGRTFTQQELDGFDGEKLIKANCLLNIIEEPNAEGKMRTKIASISPIMKNMTPLEIVNTEPPAWIDKMRQQSIEATEEKFGPMPDQGQAQQDDDLPF